MNDISANLTNYENSNSNTPNAKKRVQRYCPKLDKIKFNLKCEWTHTRLSCNQIFSNMDFYLDHIDQHIDFYCSKKTTQNYECEWDGCDSDSFDCESTYKRHVRFHAFHTKLKQIGSNVLEGLHNKQKDSKQPQNSPKCNLDEQTRNVIPELPYKFECSWDSCGYTTDNPELFYRHVKQSHVDTFEPKDTNSKCLWSQCEQKLSSKYRLVEHIRHHSQEKVVACPDCGSLFSTFSKFIDHCSRSSEIGSLCFQCSHCNKKFATNNLLKEHIRKHINKCKCPICDMTCIDKNDLSKHILYKHTTHKAFKCSLCDHSCKTQNDLQRHMNQKHNERYEYQCNECEFKSKELNNIKKHMLKFHLNGEGSYLVNDGQQFSSSYMCHVCNKVYCQGSTLSKHLKSRHNFEWPSGHSRFRYKLESDGYYRLQTLRYESVELVEEINKNNANINMTITSETNTVNLNQDMTTSSLTNTQHPSDNYSNLVSTSRSSFLDNTNSNTLNDLTNNQSVQIQFNNFIQFNDNDQIQLVDNNQSIQSNTTASGSNMIDYHQLMNYDENNQMKKSQTKESILVTNQDAEGDDDECESDEDMDTDQEFLNQNYILEVNAVQRSLVDVGDRIEFDLENFLNSNFRVKEQNEDDNDVNFYQHENNQDDVDVVEYKTINLIDNQHQNTLINNFN